MKVLLVAVFCVALVTSVANDLLDCDSLERSLLNPLRCHDFSVPLDAPGVTYRNLHANLSLDPVVLLPGLGGSGLEARLHKDAGSHWYCSRNMDWYRIWLHLEELAVQDCWFDNIRLEYNITADRWMEPEGVEMRPIDFGGVQGIDYLDYQLGSPVGLTAYYGTMIKSLQAVGYQVGYNLRGVPYDWRYTPESLQEAGLFDALRDLIEQTHQATGKRVHILTHSQGCVTALAFQHAMGSSWCDQHVNTFIPIAGPWNGAAKPLRALMSGDDFGVHVSTLHLLDRLRLRDVARNLGGVIYLVPTKMDWPTSFVFVQTPTRNYTAADLLTLFNDMNSPQTAAVYQQVHRDLENLPPPLVPTHCIYGTGVPTEISYRYSSSSFDDEPVITFSPDGDGTVNAESLQECLKWQTEPVSVKVVEFNLLNHIDILKDEQVIHYVLDQITRSA